MEISLTTMTHLTRFNLLMGISFTTISQYHEIPSRNGGTPLRNPAKMFIFSISAFFVNEANGKKTPPSYGHQTYGFVSEKNQHKLL